MRSLSVRLVDGDEGKDASLVVVGFDRLLSYDRLRIATLAIRSGAAFVASNSDATIPAPDGLWPGAGATVAALRAATGVDPPIAGKPMPLILDIAEDRLGGAPALVIGDRADTDVLAAQAKGWPSALVLTGASRAADLALGAAWPDFLLRRLSDVLEDLPHPTLRPAVGPDLPTIASLLHEGDMPAGAVRERVGRTLVAELDRRTLIATAAWEPVQDGIGLLRSVSVTERVRGKGVGALIVAGTLRAAAAAGLKQIYLVTPSAEGFFARCGFTTVRRDQLPDSVARHRQVTRDCPSTAAVMHLVLSR
jgi:N-acetylglutamate synthase-like GNAT family acetyltransferase